MKNWVFNEWSKHYGIKTGEDAQRKDGVRFDLGRHKKANRGEEENVHKQKEIYTFADVITASSRANRDQLPGAFSDDSFSILSY